MTDEMPLADEAPREEEVDREETQGGEPARPAEPRRAQQPAPGGKSGFFHVYKPGQGYWTRMGTVAGCVLLLALVGKFLFDQITGHFTAENTKLVAGCIVGGIVLASAVFLWWLLTRPTVADFMIATESEMKKVNWTSRKELIGSTKVVIFFMFMISAVLFAIDIIFGYVFHWITVLKQPPF